MKTCSYLKFIKDFLLEMISPTKCLGCNLKNEILCNNCISKIKLAERETDKNIVAVFDYRDPVMKKAIWKLKYHHNHYIGEKLGKLLYEFLIEDIAEIKTYVSGRSIYVIPVPISSKKTKIRGYNQTLAISKWFCNSAQARIFELKNNIVIKKVETIPQAKITDRKRRLENVRGVFEVKNKEVVKGRTIIVIDDVTTTGGTMNEMIKVLKKAGAKKVVGFAVAH
jgi:competence protein ComFC